MPDCTWQWDASSCSENQVGLGNRLIHRRTHEGGQFLGLIDNAILLEVDQAVEPRDNLCVHFEQSPIGSAEISTLVIKTTIDWLRGRRHVYTFPHAGSSDMLPTTIYLTFTPYPPLRLRVWFTIDPSTLSTPPSVYVFHCAWALFKMLKGFTSWTAATGPGSPHRNVGYNEKNVDT